MDRVESEKRNGGTRSARPTLYSLERIHKSVGSVPVNAVLVFPPQDGENCIMNTPEEIQSAVAGLPPAELSRFRIWFEEFDAAAWDKQWEQDVALGKLDDLACLGSA
jgi:hypothetical protein